MTETWNVMVQFRDRGTRSYKPRDHMVGGANLVIAERASAERPLFEVLMATSVPLKSVATTCVFP